MATAAAVVKPIVASIEISMTNLRNFPEGELRLERYRESCPAHSSPVGIYHHYFFIDSSYAFCWLQPLIEGVYATK
jgi:hypothetical protein